MSTYENIVFIVNTCGLQNNVFGEENYNLITKSQVYE